MTTPDIPDEPIEMLLGVLDLVDTGARTARDIYTGRSHPMPHGRVFGGQVAAQAVTAATRTVAADRFAHSMHGYFLRPGDTREPITFAVDRTHDGRSFSRRGVLAYQAGVPIFSSIISFQDDDPGFSHQEEMPTVPAPESLDPITTSYGWPSELLRANPIEARHIAPEAWLPPEERAVRDASWVRIRGRLGDDPAQHRAVLAYMSDFTIQQPVLRANGISWRTEGLRSASLDHAVWWHRPARADEWLLYASESTTSQGGRGLSTGQLFTRDGVLVATVTQEFMLRVPHQG